MNPPPGNGMAPCHRCGEPAVAILAGTRAEIVANPLITIWCNDCALAEEASRITAWAAVRDELEADDA